MKAVILAAGEGTRFRPLTEYRPKPMLPVANKPLLEHIVEALATAGIDDIVIVVGDKRERIQSHFENGDDWNLTIEYVRQDTPRGTGDALLQAEAIIDDDFIVLNGDRIVESSLIERLADRRASTGNACMAITQVDDPTLYGMVTVSDERIDSLIEKPPSYAATSKLVNAGAYAFGPEIFAAIRRTDHHGELELTSVIAEHLTDHPVEAVRYDGVFLELTHPWDLLAANDGLLSRLGTRIDDTAELDSASTVGTPVAIGADCSLAPGARVLRNTTLGDNVRIGANAVVMNSIILSDATIGPGTILIDTIVGEGTQISANCTADSGDARIIINDELHHNTHFGSLIGDFADVNADVTLTPGTILGNNTTVESGCSIDGTISSESTVQRG